MSTNRTEHLTWQERADRVMDGTAAITYTKGSYSGRYNIAVDGARIGWVVKVGSEWHGYSAAVPQWDSVTRRLVSAGHGRQVAIGRTRREAAKEVALQRRHDLGAFAAYEAQETRDAEQRRRELAEMRARWSR